MEPCIPRRLAIKPWLGKSASEYRNGSSLADTPLRDIRVRWSFALHRFQQLSLAKLNCLSLVACFFESDCYDGLAPRYHLVTNGLASISLGELQHGFGDRVWPVLVGITASVLKL